MFFPEIKTVLKKLYEMGLKIGIASNNQKEVIEKYLVKYGIREFADALVSGEEITHLKPDPQIITLCLKKLGTDAENAVYVGDMDYDMDAGKNAGVKVVAVTYGWHPREVLEGL